MLFSKYKFKKNILFIGTSKNAAMDAISKGRTPREIKAGDIDLTQVAKKGMRLYSNKGFRDELQKISSANINSIDPVKRQAARDLSVATKNLETDNLVNGLMELAKAGVWKPSGTPTAGLRDLMQKGELGAAIRSGALPIGADERKLVTDFGLASGLVPNFAPHSTEKVVGAHNIDKIINTIEKKNRFQAKKTMLCNWCYYWEECPSQSSGNPHMNTTLRK